MAKVEHKRGNARAGTEKLERNAQRARYSEPPAAKAPEQKKSALHAVESKRRTQPQKGSRSVYHAPPKIERGISMSNTEIQSKVNELRELRRMADELAERFTKSTTSRRLVVA